MYLSLKEAEAVIQSALDADQPLMVQGAPGIGKTALIQRIAAARGLPALILQLGEVTEVDVGGFPVVVDGKSGRHIDRVPLGPVHEACERPGLLFLDDYRTATLPVQGTSLRLLQGKAVGDRHLHKDTRVILAANPTHMTPGGSPMSCPIRSRVLIIDMRPLVNEIAPYFAELGEEGSALRDLGLDFSATLDMAPDLLQMDPPQKAIDGEDTWASPRSWEKGIRTAAALITRGIEKNTSLYAATLEAAVGAEKAIQWMAIAKIRNILPSQSEIQADPKNARLPADKHGQIACLGLLAQVGARDPGAAWIYAARLPEGEARTVVGRRLSKTHHIPMSAQWKSEGAKARAKMLGNLAQAQIEEI